MPFSWFPRASACPRSLETWPLADCRPLPPGPTWVGAESSHAALAVLRGALARFACVCVPVRACACAALTCRLLTEVFVCTQASELRGPPALPPATLRAAPLSQAPLGPRCVSLPPAHRPCRPGPCPSLPSPPHPRSILGQPMSPYGPSLPKRTHGWAGWELPHGLGARRWGAAVRGIKTTPQSLPKGEHPTSACAAAAIGPVCLSVCLSVCL